MNSYLENAYNDEAIERAVQHAVPCPRCSRDVGVPCRDPRTGNNRDQPHADRLRKGYAGFQEMVAKLSLDGLSLADIADKLGLVPQRFTAYHAKWMRDRAEPLNLENV